MREVSNGKRLGAIKPLLNKGQMRIGPVQRGVQSAGAWLHRAPVDTWISDQAASSWMATQRTGANEAEKRGQKDGVA